MRHQRTIALARLEHAMANFIIQISTVVERTVDFDILLQ